MYLIEFKELPFSVKTDNDWRKFRNDVIHNGRIPTKDEALKYGDYVRKFILSTIIKIQKEYNNELMELICVNLQEKSKKNINNYQLVTMCQENILSLVNGEIEKSLTKDFISEIESMKKLEFGMKVH